MVHDQLIYLKHYISDELYGIVQRFLEKVSEETPEGEYTLKGKKVFARVMSYSTSQEETCQIEAHKKYIDIQATISGAEGISIFKQEGLQAKTQYDDVSDVTFFEKDEVNPYIRCENIPGYFTLLYPWEAHRPQERIDEKGFVKKFVIKVRMEE